MTFDPALLDALDDLVSEWSGTIWRVVINGTDLPKPNQRGARWNPPFVEALYGSLEPETARTELEYVLAAQSVEVMRKRVVYEFNIVIFPSEMNPSDYLEPVED